jgi:regulatory associated protein of mTOR
LASIVYKFEQGQANALNRSLLSTCSEQIERPDFVNLSPVLRKWFVICLGNLWLNYEDARWSGARDLAYEKLYKLLEDPVPEVRASTVYALGTFISSTLERTSQANDLDRQIAMKMLERVSLDMSPLVRMELVAALQWIVKLFDNQFVEVYLRDDGSTLNRSQDGSLTRSGTRTRTNSERNLALMNSERIFSQSYSSVYSRLWSGIINLSRDPYPDVAIMGSKVTEYIKQMAIDLAPTLQMIPLAKEVTCDRTPSSGGSNSYSLPPSPNTRNFNNYMSNSHSGSAARLNDSTSSNTSNREKIHKLRIPIVKTNLIEWEINSFARPFKYLMNHKGTLETDQFSQETVWRKQRFERNEKVRKEGVYQQRTVVFNTIKTQNFIGRTAMIPSLVKLHPYEQQIAVAYMDRIMLKNWSNDQTSTLSPLHLNSPNYSSHSATIQPATNAGKKMSVTSSSTIRVSSIQFVNAHDRSLVLAGYDDGTIRIWKNGNVENSSGRSQNNGILVTAFQAIDEPSSKSSRIYGLQTAWHQSSQTIIAGGESKMIRLWDAQTELKIQDIPAGTDFAVSHICFNPNALFAVAYGDGSIQLYDKRTPDSRVMNLFKTYREHSTSILAISLRDDCESLISGS